jgi:hypothetical protein
MSRNRKAGGGLNQREAKAAALDQVVKRMLSDERAKDAAKTARLRALRLARVEAERDAANRSTKPRR